MRKHPQLFPMAPLLCGMLLLFSLGGCATTDAAKRPGTPDDWRAEMQPPLEAEEAQVLAEELHLAEAVRLAVVRNPRAAAARARWLAQIHVEPQAISLEDPMLEIGYELRSAEDRVGTPEWGLQLEQMIPWPQKLWARGKVAGIGADIARIQYEAALRDLVIEVKDACYELYWLDQALPITEGVEAMLRKDALLAYSELTVGRTAISEAFRAESAAAQLAYDRILLAEQRMAQAERLRTLLNLPPGAAIGPVRHAPVYETAADIDTLHARAENYSEMLRTAGLETQRAAYETFLARLARIPDITLGATYTFLGDVSTPRTSPALPDTGMEDGGMKADTGGAGMPGEPSMRRRDPIMGMLSMNLPIYEARNRAFIREREAMEQAMRLDALNTLNEVRAGVARAYFQVRLTERIVALYSHTLLPQARAVLDQAEILYRSDQASFSNLLETTLAYHNFSLALVRAQADHGQALGQLERVLGTTAELRENAP